MFTLILNTIKASSGKLSPVEVMDVLNIIAKNVLVGGVRRSSQIALGSEDDQDFIDAKVDYKNRGKKHRNMSNNSIVFLKKPTREKIEEVLDRIKNSWEPGILNYAKATQKRGWFATINPCGETLLGDMGNCNLSGICLPLYVENKNIDYEKVEQRPLHCYICC